MFDADVEEIFISSPSDAKMDKEAIVETIHLFNARFGKSRRLVFLPVTQESLGFSQMGKNPQTTLNEQAVDQCDFLIGCFKARFGTKTELFGSGTEEEIDIHIKKKNHVAIYFSEEAIDRSSCDLRQLKKLEDFKRRIGSEGYYESYSSITDLKEKVLKNLVSYADRENAKRTRFSSLGSENHSLSPRMLESVNEVKSKFLNLFYMTNSKWGPSQVGSSPGQWDFFVERINSSLINLGRELSVIFRGQANDLVSDFSDLITHSSSLSSDHWVHGGDQGIDNFNLGMESLMTSMRFLLNRDWEIRALPSLKH
jgi:hypothetical protein